MDDLPDPLLHIQNLHVQLKSREGTVRAVEGVTVDIMPSQIVGIVGESGSGKSTTALSVIKLLPSTAIAMGKIFFDGSDLLGFSEKQMRSIRGSRISMIFQDPTTYLNPVMKIGRQIGEAIRLHLKTDPKGTEQRVINGLRSVGIAQPDDVAHQYPHQLSGGMKQRTLIAMALSCAPSLLIADEPTTALDVTIQMQILNLVRDLVKKKLGISVMLITHDLGVVAELCDRVYVMYAGKIAEEAKAEDLFEKPRHPYTSALLKSVLSITETRRLEAIEGEVPNLTNPPKGCRFHPRCPKAMDACQTEDPSVHNFGNGHKVSCLLYQDSVR